MRMISRAASGYWRRYFPRRFRSAEGAWRTIEGYEAMNVIRKGQIRWLAKGDVTGQRQSSTPRSVSLPDSTQFWVVPREV
jgi:hypothetical protein